MKQLTLDGMTRRQQKAAHNEVRSRAGRSFSQPKRWQFQSSVPRRVQHGDKSNSAICTHRSAYFLK